MKNALLKSNPKSARMESKDWRTHGVIGMVRTKEDPIQYRPHAQHRLQLRDSAFDLRYSAFLWVEKMIETVYNHTVDRFAKIIASNVMKVVRNFISAKFVMRSTLIVNVFTGILPL